VYRLNLNGNSLESVTYHLQGHYPKLRLLMYLLSRR